MANPSPTIVFSVDLTLLRSESVGPNTNLADTGMLNPDRHSEDQDAAISSIDDRKNHRSVWMPDRIGCNRSFKHGYNFTEYGLNAIYLKNHYGINVTGVPTHRQILTIISETI